MFILSVIKYIPVYRVVNLDEWGWKEYHQTLRKMNSKNPVSGYIKFDFGKLIGMFEALEELKEKDE